MAEQKSNLIIVLVGGLIVLAVLGKLPFGNQEQAAPTPVTTPTQVPAVAPGCKVEDTTIDLAPQDIFAKGSNVDLQVDYWINGEYVGKNYSTSDTNEITASPGDNFVTLATVNSNGSTSASPKIGGTGIGVTNSYYGAKKTFTVPCVGTYVDSEYVYKADDEFEDRYNGSAGAAYQAGGNLVEDLTVSVFDENDQVNGHASNELSVGTSVYSAQIKMKVASKMYFSNPEAEKGIVVCFDADASTSSTVSEYDEVKITNYGSKAAPVPESLLGTADWCWELTELTHLKDGETVYLDLDIDPDDSDGPDAEDHMGFWIVDTNYYIHTKTGELMGPDWEDNDGNQVGLFNNATSGEGASNASIKGEHVIYIGT